MKLIIDIPEETYNDIQSRDWKNGELIFSEEWKAIQNGTPIPDNATNGDMVEKIFSKDVYCTLIRMMYSSCCEELKKWWNSPYQKGNSNEIS